MSLLIAPYSSFFCQKLFLLLEGCIRCEIMRDVCSSLPIILQTCEGRFSLEFIIENTTTTKEQKLTIDLLSPNISLLLSDKSYFRIIECIIGCYNQANIIYILEHVVKKLLELIKCREGFFLAKALINSVKSEYIQVLIVNKISKHFSSFFKFNNGILVVKLVIKSFTETEYVYHKNASKHLYSDPSLLEVKHTFSKNSFSTLPLELFFQNICSHIDKWDTKPWRGILTYSLKTCDIFCYKIFNLIAKNSAFVCDFSKLKVADKLMKLIIKNSSADDFIILCRGLKRNFHCSPEMDSELYKTIISMISTIDEIAPSSKSKSSVPCKTLNHKSYSTNNINAMKNFSNCHLGSIEIGQFPLSSNNQPCLASQVFPFYNPLLNRVDYYSLVKLPYN